MTGIVKGWYRAAELASGGYAVDVYYREEMEGDKFYRLDVYHETNKARKLSDSFKASAAYDPLCGPFGVSEADMTSIGARVPMLIERLEQNGPS